MRFALSTIRAARVLAIFLILALTARPCMAEDGYEDAFDPIVPADYFDGYWNNVVERNHEPLLFKNNIFFYASKSFSPRYESYYYTYFMGQYKIIKQINSDYYDKYMIIVTDEVFCTSHMNLNSRELQYRNLTSNIDNGVEHISFDIDIIETPEFDSLTQSTEDLWSIFRNKTQYGYNAKDEGPWVRSNKSSMPGWFLEMAAKTIEKGNLECLSPDEYPHEPPQ